MQIKHCPKCGRDKPIDQFHRDAREADGRRWLCKTCQHEQAQKHYAANQDGEKLRASRRHASNRERVLDHYGRSCACCSSTARPTIDHVNGDGKQHRAEVGHALYRWLIANDFPAGFQTLCHPCNISKRDGQRCHLDHNTTSGAAAA
jgi:hypothetical protein